MISQLSVLRSDPRYRRTVKAVCSGAAARVLISLVSLLSLPLCVRYLGAERYGVWATVTTTAVWINLLDLGIGNTLTNHISTAYARNDRQSAGRYLTNALLLTAGASAAAGVLFLFLFRFIDWAKLLNTTADLAEVRHTVAIAATLTLVGLPCSLCSKVLAGYQQLHRYSYAAALGAIASLIGLALGIAGRVSMPALYAMTAGCATAAGLGLLFFTIWEKRWLVPRASAVHWASMQQLLTSGTAFLMIQIAAVVVFSSDNVIVSHYLGSSEVTPYSVTWRLAGLVALLQTLVFPAVWPAYAEAYAKGDSAWIRKTFVAMVRATAALNVLGACILVAFGRQVIGWWAGKTAVPSFALLWAMAVWVILSGLMTVESCLLAAVNRIRVQAFLSLIAAAVNVGLSIVLVQRWGAVGAIAGTILSYVLVLVVPQTMVVRSVWRNELRRKDQRLEKLVAPSSAAPADGRPCSRLSQNAMLT